MREQKLEIIIIKALYKCDPTKNIECSKGVCLKMVAFAKPRAIGNMQKGTKMGWQFRQKNILSTSIHI